MRIQTLPGRIELSFSITAEGTVEGIRTTTTGPFPIGFRHCMATEFRELQFGEMIGGDGLVNKTFVFETAE